jgi:hypothetical protein
VKGMKDARSESIEPAGQSVDGTTASASGDVGNGGQDDAARLAALRDARVRAATNHALGTLWGITGWVAYVADLTIVVLAATIFTQYVGAFEHFSPLPWIALYGFGAVALTIVLHRVRALRITIHWIAPILFILLITFFSLFSPTPVRRSATSSVGRVSTRALHGRA